MNKSNKFSFGNDSIAQSYDTTLVPQLFETWAKNLIEMNAPWTGFHVLDLACGTGVVTKELAQNVFPGGKIIALDINSQMLDLARIKCDEWANHIEFIEGSADSLGIPDNSMDRVICQQGFQFFPNKKVAAHEIFRVLKFNGKAILSTWCPVSECEIFGAICETLESLGLNEVSEMMRIPFDHMTQEELLDSFKGIGFSKIHISKQEEKLYLKGSEDIAIKFAYSTPIGPSLNALSRNIQKEFKRKFTEKVKFLNDKDKSVGRMVANVITIEK